MIRIADIYKQAEVLINQIIAREMVAQGHHLTGAMEESLTAKISSTSNTDTMDGFAVYYTQFVDQGVPAESASFKQFPFIVKYFQQRGLEEEEAKRAAAATIKVWMKQGMSTQASKRFSSTGSRQNMVENSLIGSSDKIDAFITEGIDFVVEEKFQTEKSETI
jgi:hypothetical protein